MSRTQLRKIRGDLFSRKFRTLLVAMSIFVGVLGVVTLSSTSNLFMDQLREDLREDQLPMMVMVMSAEVDDLTPGESDWQAAVDALEGYPGVTVVERFINDRLFWKTADEEHYIESGLRSYITPLDQLDIESMQLVEGAYPVAGQKQVAVERQMADAFELQVGDTLDIALVSQLTGTEQAGGVVPAEAWRISAIVFHPYSAGNVVNRMFVQYADAVYLNGAPASNTIVMRFTDFPTAEAAEEDIKAMVNETTALEVDFVTVIDPANHPFLVEMKGWTDTLVALSYIAMFVSSMLVVTVIMTIVIEQRRQIGALKSLGASRWDTFLMYAGLAMAYGLIGTIPGVLLGIPAGYLMLKMVSPLVGLLVEGLLISWTAVITGVVMGLLVPLVASVLPVVLGTRVTICEAMTDLGLGSAFGLGGVSRMINRVPLPVSLRQAVANAYQKRGRLALTGFTLTLAAGAFMGIVGMFLSVNSSMEGLFNTYHTDLIVEPTSKDFDYDRLHVLLSQQVEGVEMIYAGAGRWAEAVTQEAPEPGGDEELRFVLLRGVDPSEGALRYELSAGERIEDSSVANGALLGESLAKALGKSVGDVVSLKLADDQRLNVTIVGVSKSLFDEVIVPWQTVAALDDRTTPTQLWLKFEGDPTGGDVERAMAEIRDLLLGSGVVADFQNIRAIQEENANVMLTVGIIFNFASMVMAVVGAIGLLTMLTISVFERQREIGVMRSIGASSRAIAGQFLTEGLVIGLAAWAVGVPLSYLIGAGLLAVLPMEGFEFNYPVLVLAAGFLGMTLLATAASIGPSLSAARRTVSDILRYE